MIRITVVNCAGIARLRFGADESVVESGRRLNRSRRCRRAGILNQSLLYCRTGVNESPLTKPCILPILFETCDRNIVALTVIESDPEVS